MTPKDYAAAEAGLGAKLGAPGSPASAEALQDLAEFYSFLGKNLWCFEFNREPTLACPVLPFEDWDEFDAFFKTMPEELGWVELLEKAVARTREALAAWKAVPSPAAEGALWQKLASLYDLMPDAGSPLDCYTEAQRIFVALQDEESLGEVHMGLAHHARYRSYETAHCVKHLEQAKACFQKAGSVLGMAHATARLAENQGEHLERCTALYEEASGLFEQGGDFASAVNCLASLTKLIGEKGLKDDEEALFVRTLALVEKHFQGEDLAQNYEAASHFYGERGQTVRSEAYLKKAQALRGAAPEGHA